MDSFTVGREIDLLRLNSGGKVGLKSHHGVVETIWILEVHAENTSNLPCQISAGQGLSKWNEWDED